MKTIFWYFCAGCGCGSREDFWECPECFQENIVQVELGIDGRIREDYEY